MFKSILDWILNNKITTFLCVTTFSFVVATIAVAVEKSNLQDELTSCEDQLNMATTTTLAPSTEGPPKPPDGDYRLPIGVIPREYHLRLNPNISGDSFEGDAKILFEVTIESEKVVLHSNGLKISSLTIKSSGEGSAIIGSDFEIATNDTEFLTVSPNTKLGLGTYEMDIQYSGDLSGIVGFYKSTYGNNQAIATSKFEPTYARQAFPCFDEPAMKAKFTVELVTPLNPDYIALSNMDVVNITNESDHRIYQFRESVPMSTYLACFIVCDFVKKSEVISVGSTNFSFSVYATKEQIDKVDFSLDVGVAVTEYYIKYFGIDYPLPKLDMIAIPDFVSGAMEHWGLVTYRETNLLHSNDTTSPANAQNIARVVAHEISHMWFGNLVTMNWWNDLWLNEGFASYMQYKALDILYPHWKMMEQFLTANTHSIMALDATLNSHPIVQTVDTPDEITAIFDSVTYNKGAAVIRMLEDFVGEDNFKAGVTKYLENNKFGNTVTQDLLNELESIFKPERQNITYIMDTWTKQMGYPIISITFNSVQKAYELKQKRFLADPDNKPETPSIFNDKWTIPITCRLENGNASTIFWFYDDEETLIIPLSNLSDQKILKLNNEQVGYYRVSYETSMWDEIKTNLNNSTSNLLTPSDRANILNDVFTLAQATEENYDLALDISKYLINEKEYVPWSVGSSQLSSLKSIMSNSLAYIELKTYIRSLLVNIFDEMKNVTENSVQVERLLQSVIFNLACAVDNQDCLDNARQMFVDFINETSKPVDPNLRNTVYYYGVQQSGDVQWLRLWDIFVVETDAQEQTKLMQALAGSKDLTILNRYLELAWDEKYIRSQDHLSVVQYISGNPIGTSLVWDHVRENWPRFVEKFTLNSRTLGTMIPGITRTFATKLKLKEMEDFFALYPDAGAGATARKQAIETVKNNIKWLEMHEATVRKWLLENKP